MALAERLKRAFPGIMVDSEPGADDESGIVITSPADCPIARCRELAAAGHRVLIVAPIPQPAQAEAYASAGAASYLPMDINVMDLTEAIAMSAGASRER
jgi:hypothetical protein